MGPITPENGFSSQEKPHGEGSNWANQPPVTHTTSGKDLCSGSHSVASPEPHTCTLDSPSQTELWAPKHQKLGFPVRKHQVQPQGAQPTDPPRKNSWVPAGAQSPAKSHSPAPACSTHHPRLNCAFQNTTDWVSLLRGNRT